MKIRIKGNTVRYRLSKTEVALLAKNGLLQEQTEFINNTLLYSIKQTNEAALSADFYNNNIVLYIPNNKLQEWAKTDQVGVDAHFNLPNGNELYLLLEKDFKCTDMDAKEDQSDYFENPHLTC